MDNKFYIGPINGKIQNTIDNLIFIQDANTYKIENETLKKNIQLLEEDLTKLSKNHKDMKKKYKNLLKKEHIFEENKNS